MLALIRHAALLWRGACSAPGLAHLFGLVRRDKAIDKVLDIAVEHAGQDRASYRRSLDAPARLRHRHALHAVDAPFELELAVGALAPDFERHLVKAAQPGLLDIDQLRLPLTALSVSRVHPVELRGE